MVTLILTLNPTPAVQVSGAPKLSIPETPEQLRGSPSPTRANLQKHLVRVRTGARLDPLNESTERHQGKQLRMQSLFPLMRLETCTLRTALDHVSGSRPAPESLPGQQRR